MKVRNFCKMMMALGHEVFLYAGETTDVPCTELITCISESERAASLSGRFYVDASFDYAKEPWLTFNSRAIDAVRSRAEKTDFLCLIAGLAQKQVADAFPAMVAVEFGVGYGGSFANFRVFESYAWMHTCYGAANGGNPHGADGRWYDTVIPGYLDMKDFPAPGSRRREYLLFVGRMTDRKGIGVARQVAKASLMRLIVAGPGTPPPGVEYAGVVGVEERARLMGGARALLCPTIYVEPFGNVAIEAMAVGTPVISTDWGAFTETVQQGVTGFRCRTLQEFVDAVRKVGSFDHGEIRTWASEHYSLPVIAERYETYFAKLLNLWERGWSTLS